MAKWIWFVDGEETNARGIIRLAKEAGYLPGDNIYRLEAAAVTLENEGHIVEQWETGEYTK